MNNFTGWQGKWKITVMENGRIIEETEIKNRIMDVALDELLKSLQGVSPDLEIKYMALGTSNTAVTNTQTQLDTEIFRTAPVSQAVTGTGELTTGFIVLDTESVGLIEEIGIFGGSLASVSANSGTLISRILWSRNKTASEEIQFTRIDRMIRG